MIKLRIKNKSKRPKFHVGDILDFLAVKCPLESILKTLWPRNGHADSLGFNSIIHSCILSYMYELTQTLINYIEHLNGFLIF